MKKVKKCTKLVPFFARDGRLRPKWTLSTLFGHYFINTHSRHYVPLTKNKLQQVLEKHLRELEAEITKELARDINVGWIELEWKREKLEQSVIEACKVVRLKERPLTTVDHTRKLCPVWSHDGTVSGSIL